MFDIFVIYCSSLSPSLFCVCKLGQFSISCHGGQYLTLAILPLSCSVRYHPESAAANIIWYHPKSSDISQYHLISANISQYHPIQSGMSCANIIANFLSSFGFTLSLWDCSSIVFTLPPYCTFITSWHFLQQIRILSNCHHHQNIWGHLTLRCTSDFLFITDMLWKLDWNPRCTAPGFWLQFVTQGQVYMKRIFSGISTKTLKDRPPPDFDWQ